MAERQIRNLTDGHPDYRRCTTAERSTVTETSKVEKASGLRISEIYCLLQ